MSTNIISKNRSCKSNYDNNSNYESNNDKFSNKSKNNESSNNDSNVNVNIQKKNYVFKSTHLLSLGNYHMYRKILTSKKDRFAPHTATDWVVLGTRWTSGALDVCVNVGVEETEEVVEVVAVVDKEEGSVFCKIGFVAESNDVCVFGKSGAVL